MKFRVDISIRARGQTPFDWKELKSEDYDDLSDFATAVADFITDNCLDYLEGEEDDEQDYPESQDSRVVA